MARNYSEEEKQKLLDKYKVSGKVKLPTQEKMEYQKLHLGHG